MFTAMNLVGYYCRTNDEQGSDRIDGFGVLPSGGAALLALAALT